MARQQTETLYIYIENLPFPHIIFVPSLFVSAAVLRASEGLVKREPGGPLDLRSMHRTYSGNYSFFNAFTVLAISPLLSTYATSDGGAAFEKAGEGVTSTAPHQWTVSLCAPAIWEEPDQTVLQTHSLSHQSLPFVFFKKKKNPQCCKTRDWAVCNPTRGTVADVPCLPAHSQL